MYGAILGDIIGSPYEFDRGDKSKVFPLFSGDSEFTDDTVMTVAVCEAFLEAGTEADDARITDCLVRCLRKWGRKYPNAGYGVRFSGWLRAEDAAPYGSYGNGAAMRVSAAAWLFDGMEAVRCAARLSAKVTHNHPEGIKGAEATAAAIYLARIGRSKTEIRQYVEEAFEYDLSRTCDEIRPGYYHVESCQESVPQAITAFLEGESFEDVIRTAVSLGGDCDTVAAIAGSVAEGFYGVPASLKEDCRGRLPQEIADVAERFENAVKERAKDREQRLQKAVRFAESHHEGQLRKGTTLPYIRHPVAVMSTLRDMYADAELQMAGVLHDTVEDTAATGEDILQEFGADVAALVGSHTEDKSKTWKERKSCTIHHLATADRRVKMLVMADRISNLRDLAADYAALGDDVWRRFQAPKSEQAWYSFGVCDALEEMGEYPETKRVYEEMKLLCKEIFGEG